MFLFQKKPKKKQHVYLSTRSEFWEKKKLEKHYWLREIIKLRL